MNSNKIRKSKLQVNIITCILFHRTKDLLEVASNSKNFSTLMNDRIRFFADADLVITAAGSLGAGKFGREAQKQTTSCASLVRGHGVCFDPSKHPFFKSRAPWWLHRYQLCNISELESADLPFLWERCIKRRISRIY